MDDPGCALYLYAVIGARLIFEWIKSRRYFALEGPLPMKRNLALSGMLLLLALLPAVSRTEEPDRPAAPGQTAARNQLQERAKAVRPTAKELAWLTIPWVLDLKAAQTTARSEGRPIFLWVTGDDPLERC